MYCESNYPFKNTIVCLTIYLTIRFDNKNNIFDTFRFEFCFEFILINLLINQNIYNDYFLFSLIIFILIIFAFDLLLY